MHRASIREMGETATVTGRKLFHGCFNKITSRDRDHGSGVFDHSLAVRLAG